MDLTSPTAGPWSTEPTTVDLTKEVGFESCLFACWVHAEAASLSYFGTASHVCISKT